MAMATATPRRLASSRFSNLHFARPGLGTPWACSKRRPEAGSPILVTACQHEPRFSAHRTDSMGGPSDHRSSRCQMVVRVHRLSICRAGAARANTRLGAAHGPVYPLAGRHSLRAYGDIDLSAPTARRAAPAPGIAPRSKRPPPCSAMPTPLIMAGDCRAQSRAHAELIELADPPRRAGLYRFLATPASVPASHPLFPRLP